MKIVKRIISGIVLFALLVLVACSSEAKQNNYLTSWTNSAVAKNKILDYVENVTNSKSPDFIPESESSYNVICRITENGKITFASLYLNIFLNSNWSILRYFFFFFASSRIPISI